MMKAWVCTRYGGPEVLRLVDRPTPAVGPRDVLVKVVCTTVNSGDWRLRALAMPRGMALIGRLAMGLRGPRQPVLGSELSGTVVAAGPEVTRFAVGDPVMVFAGMRLRCHAEYHVVPEDGRIEPKPDSVGFEQAAAVGFGGSTALHFLRKAQVRAGDRLLIIGASGAVGSAMVQLARRQGAVVTAVTSTGNVEWVRGLGADRVVDYTRDAVPVPEGGYEIVADTVGARPMRECLRLVRGDARAAGRFLAIAGGVAEMWAAVVGSRGGKRVIAGPAAERAEDFRELVALLARGEFRPFLGRTFAFSDLVEAHRYVESGRKQGSAVVRVSG